ncbi:hypothetical protein LWI28_019132 [Acer negundo]|uniref:Uncharacterized protein n=1 Tax=Acer negundo TaxID=4023 RepID=A0AAD5I6T0_ACENE|nr:hypothetical protein LWI28_019132 [Acer negundo]KAK4834566.1 hypothetical protein QYF36_024976 [Acer negundo]
MLSPLGHTANPNANSEPDGVKLTPKLTFDTLSRAKCRHISFFDFQSPALTQFYAILRSLSKKQKQNSMTLSIQLSHCYHESICHLGFETTEIY